MSSRVLLLLLPVLVFGLSGCPAPTDDDDSADDDDDSSSDDDDSAIDDDDSADDDDDTLSPELQQVVALCGQEPTMPKGAGYDGPMSDLHFHLKADDDPAEFAAYLLVTMNALGVERMALSGPDRVPASLRRDLEGRWAPVIAACPRLLYMLGGFDLDDAGAADYVAGRLTEAPFSGVGELVLYRKGELGLQDPQTPEMQPVYDLMEERGLAVGVHADENQPTEEALFELFDQRPGITFIWFGCPILAPPNPLPDNLVCNRMLHDDSDDVGDGLDLLLWGRAAYGSDVPPSPTPRLPFETLEEAIPQARTKLFELEIAPATRDAVAIGNFDRAFPRDR
jgi:hypothetical protein